jgi:DNA processing protein
MWQKLSPIAHRTSSRVSELALAVFASETGTHLIRPPRGERWRAFERRFDERAYLERLAEGGHRFLPRSSPDFPALLRAIHDPPAGLFLRGVAKPDLLAQPSIAIVGARASSGYGASVARSLGRELASAGLVVVSGLARGIDAEAHRGALEAKGTTVAVLGCGIDRDYPAAHAELARRVADAGLIVSEYAPGVEPAPWRFPARNRIVAGLCAVTVVVEARERSGALITADLALEEGREVFAVPGEITSSLSAGTNALLKLGAAPLTGAADVLASFGIDPEPAQCEGSPLLELLPASADEIVRRTGLRADEVARALVELELEGRVVVRDGMYRRAS